MKLTMEKNVPVIWEMVTQVGCARCFLLIRFRLCDVSKNTTDMMLCCQYNIVSNPLLSVINNLDYLVKVVSSQFLHYKVTIFLLVINMYLGVGEVH